MTTDNTMRAAVWRSSRDYLDLLQLHRKAVLQADADISDLFEIRLREFVATALAAARAEGYKAGMERAAEICDEASIEQEICSTEARVAQYCADEIRFEIDKPDIDVIRAEIGKEGE